MAYKRKTEEEVRESYKKRGLKRSQLFLNPTSALLAGFKKASESKKERAKNPTPKMLANWERGPSEETRQKQRESAIKRWGKKEERERQSLAMKKSYESGTREPLPPFTEEHKQNIKEAAAKREANPTQAMIEGRSKPFTEERKQKISAKLTKAWEEPTPDMLRIVEALRKARKHGPYRPSKAQTSLYEMICKAAGSGFVMEFPIHIYALDIADPERKLCVEVDDPYYHSGDVAIKDAMRDQYLQSLGWKVFRVGTSKRELLQGLDWVKAQLGIQSPTLFKEDPCRSSS